MIYQFKSIWVMLNAHPQYTISVLPDIVILVAPWAFVYHGITPVSEPSAALQYAMPAHVIGVYDAEPTACTIIM